MLPRCHPSFKRRRVSSRRNQNGYRLLFIRLTPGYAAMLLERRHALHRIFRIGFSRMSFVRSSPESLQPSGFPLWGRGAGVLFPVIESRQISIVTNCSMLPSTCQGVACRVSTFALSAAAAASSSSSSNGLLSGFRSLFIRFM